MLTQPAPYGQPRFGRSRGQVKNQYMPLSVPSAVPFGNQVNTPHGLKVTLWRQHADWRPALRLTLAKKSSPPQCIKLLSEEVPMLPGLETLKNLGRSGQKERVQRIVE